MALPDSKMLAVTRQGDVYVIEFMITSLLDRLSIETIGREIEQLVAKSGHPKFVINFSNINQVSSSMLGVLIALNTQTKNMHGELRLAAIPTSIMQVFQLTRLDKLFKIYDSTHAAVTKF